MISEGLSYLVDLPLSNELLSDLMKENMNNVSAFKISSLFRVCVTELEVNFVDFCSNDGLMCEDGSRTISVKDMKNTRSDCISCCIDKTYLPFLEVTPCVHNTILGHNLIRDVIDGEFWVAPCKMGLLIVGPNTIHVYGKYRYWKPKKREDVSGYADNAHVLVCVNSKKLANFFWNSYQTISDGISTNFGVHYTYGYLNRGLNRRCVICNCLICFCFLGRGNFEAIGPGSDSTFPICGNSKIYNSGGFDRVRVVRHGYSKNIRKLVCTCDFTCSKVTDEQCKMALFVSETFPKVNVKLILDISHFIEDSALVSFENVLKYIRPFGIEAHLDGWDKQSKAIALLAYINMAVKCKMAKIVDHKKLQRIGNMQEYEEDPEIYDYSSDYMSWYIDRCASAFDNGMMMLDEEDQTTYDEIRDRQDLIFNEMDFGRWGYFSSSDFNTDEE